MTTQHAAPAWPFLVLPLLVVLSFCTAMTSYAPMKEALVWLGLVVIVLSWNTRFGGSKKIWLSWGSLLLWSSLSLAWSSNPSYGLRLFLLGLAGFCWCVCLVDAWVSVTDISLRRLRTQEMACSWLVAGSLTSLWGIFQKAGWIAGGQYKVVGTIGNPNRLAGVLLLCLPFVWWLVFSPERRWYRWFGVVSGLICLGGIVVTQCQSAIFACFGMLLVALAGFFTETKKLSSPVRQMLTLVGTFFVCLAGMIGWAWRTSGAALWDSLQGRLWISSLSWEVWSQQIWTGVGLGGYPQQAILSQSQPLSFTPDTWTLLMDPHNQFFDIGCQMGLVGLFLFLVTSYFVMKQLLQTSPSPLRTAIVMALLGAALYCLSETASLSVSFVLLFCFWLALVQLSWSKALSTKVSSHRATSSLWVVGLFLIVAGSWISAKYAYGDFRLGRGLTLAAQGTKDSMKRSLRMYHLALSHVDQKERVLFSRGLALRELGFFAASLKDLRTSFARFSTPECALTIAGVLYAQRKYKQAVRWGKKSIFLHSRYVRAYHNVGVFYLAQKKYRDAWRYLRRALSLRPGDPHIRKTWRSLPAKWRRRQSIREKELQ